MNSVKCLQCGLINWSDAQTCKRCQAALQADPNAEPQQPPPLSWQQTAEPQPTQPAWQPPPVYNPYPSYADYQPLVQAQMVLATRGSRLGAALLDGVFVVVPMMLGMLLIVVVGQAMAVAHDTVPAAMFAVLGLIILAVLVVQLYLLSRDGQTIGKKCVGIRIVKAETGENGGFKTNALMRSILPGLIGGIPGVGPIFRIADVLFIFREDQRCIHDLMAGTTVIKV
ncbi:MAG: hypothetical protein QOD00_1714 [Blastocatellia bacterium]|jgi:uncharacterized RDD family membrane protein YckC|nr:hypothetical protein [Blastocatellia bacterium]